MARRSADNLAASWPALVIAGWSVAALLADVLPLQPDRIDLGHILAFPGAGGLLGADDLGRDILARLVDGARVALLVAISVTAATMTAGTVLGLVAGYFGGWVDRILMHVTDVFMAFPGILLAIAFAAVLGPGIGNLVLALCLTSWVGYARLTRAQALSLRRRQHVLAAESLGASVPRIMLRHMLPPAKRGDGSVV